MDGSVEFTNQTDVKLHLSELARNIQASYDVSSAENTHQSNEISLQPANVTEATRLLHMLNKTRQGFMKLEDTDFLKEAA